MDRAEKIAHGLMLCQETQNKENETRTTLVKKLFKLNEDATLVANFKTLGSSNEDPELSSPLKPKKEAFKNSHANGKSPSPEVEKKTMSKGNWKKIAREKGKA